jgi:tetratricopeptide (TPR) repeat protein
MCVQTAAVAGRDFTLTLLTHAGSQSEAETVMALDELWRRRLVRQMRPEHYEFSHDKLRQVAYEAISPERRRWLHGKVADALVAHDSADLAASAGQIAYHYAQSSQPGRALDHLLLAADAAARIFANREAISFYEKALSLLPPDAARTRTIYEALGELWRRQGKWQESQQAYSTALALIGPEAALARAAVLDKLGRTLIAGHQRVEAWEALTAARRVLEANPDESSPDWCRVWIAVVMGQADWHYWGGSVDEMSDLVAQAEPCVRRFGAPAQQMEWQQLAARAALRRARYIISDAMVEDRRRALEAMRQLGSPAELTVAEFGYAFTLLWNGQVERAGAQFRTALQTARQIGFVFVETQCLTYLAIIARLTGQIGEARTLTLLALQSAQAIQRLDFIGIAHANQAWLAWRTGDLAAARELGAAALDEWDTAATGMPFSWLALWPLIGAALEENRVELALIYARRLLDESQQPPPHPVRTQVSTAMAVWEAGYPTQARAHLEAAAAAAAAIGHL